MMPKHSVVTNLANSTHSAHIAGDVHWSKLAPWLAGETPLPWARVYELDAEWRRRAIATRRVPKWTEIVGTEASRAA